VKPTKTKGRTGSNASKRTLCVGSGSPQLNVGQQTDNMSLTTEARHHRYWQKVLRLVSGVQLSTLPNPLPIDGTILGGTVPL
jgi:hypothetical protein